MLALERSCQINSDQLESFRWSWFCNVSSGGLVSVGGFSSIGGTGSRPKFRYAGVYPVASCVAVLNANCNAFSFSSHVLCSFPTYWLIMVLTVQLVLSAGLQCGTYAGVVMCFMLHSFNLYLSCLDLSCVSLSESIESGFPYRRIICDVTASVTNSAVALRNGISSAHFVKRSCMTSSQVFSSL